MKVATTVIFFEQIVDLDGDVLLLLYAASTGSGAESKHSEIAPAWEKLAAAFRSENEETDADPFILPQFPRTATMSRFSCQFKSAPIPRSSGSVGLAKIWLNHSSAARDRRMMATNSSKKLPGH